MTNTFIPTLSRQPLYCVWIETGNPAHPLDRVWIDPELRSFVDVKVTPTRATNDEREPEASAEPLPEKGLFAGHLSINPIRRKEMKGKACSAVKRLSWVVVALYFLLNTAWANVAGRISGKVSDPSGAFVVGATVTLKNVGNGTNQTTTTNDQGQYSFPVVPVGKYELEVSSSGFQPYKKIGVAIDVNSALQIDATMQIGQSTQTVEVNDSVVTIQMSDTEIGETISSQHVAEVPLNGRSYTDLLATQAGVSPVTTSGASNSSSGGGFGTVPVAGNENTGQFSINGQRESANGFFLNGASVQESIGQQAGVIPNLDSIAEFRIISSNADAEYGGYSGGLINVVTKSGGDKFHGSAFEFLRNTNLDARGYFSPERSTFQQNQYGGTFGGPIKKSKIFFFGDYQGQRTVEGIETGIVSVPSLLNRTGNFSDSASSLTGKVNGASLAQTLSGRLAYQVNNGESFYAPGCTSNTQCVFPNAIIPQTAFGLPATKMLQYIPSPNVGSNQFSSGAEKQRTNDDKGSVRVDADTTKYGTLSAYYFIDRYNLDDPYPVGFGGATVPGPSGAYDALSNGTDQVIVLRDTKTLGATMVNEAHASFTRLNNTLGVPKGGVGVSLADQGISSGPQGIQQGFPQFAGVETLYFNSFTVGTNPFFLPQVNNTLGLRNSVGGDASSNHHSHPRGWNRRPFQVHRSDISCLAITCRTARQSRRGLRPPRKITSRLVSVWPILPAGQMVSSAS
jgi:hypothetical protein